MGLCSAGNSVRQMYQDFGRRPGFGVGRGGGRRRRQEGKLGGLSPASMLAVRLGTVAQACITVCAATQALSVATHRAAGRQRQESKRQAQR
ncbi:hypothetical protein K431DRAFT_135495 [Polychaeton citri CBS 116435]|uniref:Uncharacterized protein n=1 Tax=Polychaeton citri CBS 116435 TaxID=1314669 RepID=A0A9P4Q0S2_9PEZI|nr:hypothetical protein K431DRAFT_135495 [Polychaeton citri CBS 116435]